LRFQLCAIFSPFSSKRTRSREHAEIRKKQFDWLATNTDDIITQSHSLFACSREHIRLVENVQALTSRFNRISTVRKKMTIFNSAHVHGMEFNGALYYNTDSVLNSTFNYELKLAVRVRCFDQCMNLLVANLVKVLNLSFVRMLLCYYRLLTKLFLLFPEILPLYESIGSILSSSLASLLH
jgi:hypothetical protein